MTMKVSMMARTQAKDLSDQALRHVSGGYPQHQLVGDEFVMTLCVPGPNGTVHCGDYM